MTCWLGIVATKLPTQRAGCADRQLRKPVDCLSSNTTMNTASLAPFELRLDKTCTPEREWVAECKFGLHKQLSLQTYLSWSECTN
jgi:hypothetical protein